MDSLVSSRQLKKVDWCKKYAASKNMRVLVEGAKSPFELLTGLLRAGPVYKIPSIFSPGGISRKSFGGCAVWLSKS